MKCLTLALLIGFSSTALAAEQYCLSDVCLFDTIDKFKFDNNKWQQADWATYPICDTSRGWVVLMHETPDGQKGSVRFDYIPGAPKGAHFRVTSVSVNLPKEITKAQGEDLKKQLITRMGLQLHKPKNALSYYGTKTSEGKITLHVSYPSNQSNFGAYSAAVAFEPDDATKKAWKNKILSQAACKKISMPKL